MKAFRWESYAKWLSTRKLPQAKPHLGKEKQPREVSFLLARGRQGNRFAGRPRRGHHSPAARVPAMRAPVYHLRADRRNTLHGDQEGRPARALRTAQDLAGAAPSVPQEPRST